MVSESIAKIAPAATAVVAAMTSALKRLKITNPQSDAIPQITAMMLQRVKTYDAGLLAFFIPAALDSPSGMFERKMAITATVLTTPDLIILTPITIDSGMPS